MTQSKSPKIRLALISGGRSGEHEVSLRSAASVRQELNPNRYQISDFFISKDGRWSPTPIVPEPGANGIDVAFPILHGTFGEDGTMQGLLELADIPYVGSGVLASAVSMDKAFTKRLCHDVGLPVVPHFILERGSFRTNEVSVPYDYPVFVKPANLGSSVGISKVKSSEDLPGALDNACQYDHKIIIEKGVIGREFECAVLDGDPPSASVPCEILPSQDFYNYEDKYLLDKARIELPAKLSDEQVREMQELAVACFKAVDGEGLARVDFLMDGASGRIYVNEINTMPGFTSISMYPKMWEYSGIPFSKLLDRLIELALQRAQMRRESTYSR